MNFTAAFDGCRRRVSAGRCPRGYRRYLLALRTPKVAGTNARLSAAAVDRGACSLRPAVASGTKHAFGEIGHRLGFRPKSAFARSGRPACFVCVRWLTLGSNAVLRESTSAHASAQRRASRGCQPVPRSGLIPLGWLPFARERASRRPAVARKSVIERRWESSTLASSSGQRRVEALRPRHAPSSGRLRRMMP